jgi:hypothetical protein
MTTNKDPADQALTPAERARLVERHHEWALMNRWLDKNNFRATLEFVRKMGHRLKLRG